jgi:hypothetical protein
MKKKIISIVCTTLKNQKLTDYKYKIVKVLDTFFSIDAINHLVLEPECLILCKLPTQYS